MKSNFFYGYLLMADMQAAWQLYMLCGIMVGIGFSARDVITLSTVARRFIKRRGMMSGIVKVGTGAGQLIVPLIAAAMCDLRLAACLRDHRCHRTGDSGLLTLFPTRCYVYFSFHDQVVTSATECFM